MMVNINQINHSKQILRSRCWIIFVPMFFRFPFLCKFPLDKGHKPISIYNIIFKNIFIYIKSHIIFRFKKANKISNCFISQKYFNDSKEHLPSSLYCYTNQFDPKTVLYRMFLLWEYRHLTSFRMSRDAITIPYQILDVIDKISAANQYLESTNKILNNNNV